LLPALARFGKPEYRLPLTLDNRIGEGENPEVAVADDYAAGWGPLYGLAGQHLFAHRLGAIHRPPDRPQGNSRSHIVQVHPLHDAPMPQPAPVTPGGKRLQKAWTVFHAQAASVQKHDRPFQFRLRRDAFARLGQHLITHLCGRLHREPSAGSCISAAVLRDFALPHPLAGRQQTLQMALGNPMHDALLGASLSEPLEQHHPDHYAQGISLRLRPALQRFPPYRGQN